jgi:hypothetical protein
MHHPYRNAIAFVAGSVFACGCGDPGAPRPTLTLGPPVLLLLVCQEGQLTVTVSPPSAGVMFRSSDVAVATVSPVGIVRGVRDGAARIHAWLTTDATVRDSAEVSVASPGPCGAGRTSRPDD